MLDDKKAKLKELLAKSKTEGNKDAAKTSSTGDNASFPFWNMKTGETTVIRLLPDGDPDSLRFWANREIITLEFAGIVGGDYPTNKTVSITVPCMKMYGLKEVCPITEAIRPWWNDGRKDLARKYYRKRTMLAQGFVVSSPLQEKETPENPIRRFIFNPQLAKIIEAEVDDIDFPYLPVDYVHGREFKITVTQNGEYNAYTTSKFSPKERSLSDEELIAIDDNGLFNLADYLPKKPSEDDLKIIMQLFQDSVDGEPFDMDKYANSPYKPYVRRDDNASAAKPAAAAPARKAAPVAAAPAEEEDAPAAPAAEAPKQSSATSTGSAQDILARIRSKTAQS